MTPKDGKQAQSPELTREEWKEVSRIRPICPTRTSKFYEVPARLFDKLIAAARKGIEATERYKQLAQEVATGLGRYPLPASKDTPGDEKAGEGMDHPEPSGEREEYAETGFDAGVKCLECGARPPGPHDRTCQRSIFNKSRPAPTSGEGDVDVTIINLESVAKRERKRGNDEFAGIVDCAAEALKRLRDEQDKEVYSRVEHWRSSVEALQAERDAMAVQVERLREALADLIKHHEDFSDRMGHPSKNLQCTKLAKAALNQS